MIDGSNTIYRELLFPLHLQELNPSSSSFVKFYSSHDPGLAAQIDG